MALLLPSQGLARRLVVAALIAEAEELFQMPAKCLFGGTAAPQLPQDRPHRLAHIPAGSLPGISSLSRRFQRRFDGFDVLIQLVRPG